MRRFTYAILIALVPVLMFSGCLSVGANKSATAQLAEQDANTALMAKAAYFDMMGIYKDTATVYLQYKPMLIERNPQVNELIKDKLNEMKSLLDQWRELNAISQLTEIDTNSPEFHAKRREILFKLAEYMEGG